MIARDAVNWVMRYTVSDTERLRKVHLFMYPEEHAGPARPAAFSGQDLPAAESRRLVEGFLEAARAQAAAGSAEAALALETLEKLTTREIAHEEVVR